MPLELENYQPQQFEDAIYSFWEKGGFFTPDPNSHAEPFCMVKPPPNVTGALHMGHALTDAIEDAIVRYKRMKGFNTLFIPGTDHAGIATQMVAERELASQGRNRFDMGREAFLEYMWELKNRHHTIIVTQMRKLGGSLDWSRECFTLDSHVEAAVKHVFIQLYREGLIYRGERMISWCPKDQTALSDLEVEPHETQGHMWRVKYLLADDDQGSYLPVETTRPETIFADTAVAVHPDDERFRNDIGRQVRVPGTDRAVPVIGDTQVDPQFGSGALKVTPGHDFVDYEIGKRHHLPILQVINTKGRMTEICGPQYQGMTTEVCRAAFVQELERTGLLESVRAITHSVGRSQRSGAVVEPMISTQWFVAVETLAKPAISAVEKGEIRFIPEHWTKTYFEWMHNIRDWCISRQLWWGHRIPAYYCGACGHTMVAADVVMQCEKCSATAVRQDPDVLDTWFSSALWPLVTLGWPKDTLDFRRYYPNQLMETGFDILFFWVARMIMFGIKFGGQVPFREVYLHAMVRDEKGHKMSKTRGNVVDPLDVIKTHGADALRFTLNSMAGQAQDVKLSKDRVEGYRNFMNKIWNAYRFLNLNTADSEPIPSSRTSETRHPVNRWILMRLDDICVCLDHAYTRYDFGEVCQRLYHFFWHEYCDWYVEFAKVLLKDPRHRQETLEVAYFVFREALKVLHPIAPFVTEKLFLSLPNKDAKAIMVAPFPQISQDQVLTDAHAQQWVVVVQDLVNAIRRVRALAGIPPGSVMQASIRMRGEYTCESDMHGFLEALGRVRVATLDHGTEQMLKGVGACGTVFVDPQGAIDVKRELERLRKEVAFVEQGKRGIDQKLNNPTFVSRAPSHLVKEEQEKRDALEEKCLALQDIVSTLEHMSRTG